MPASQPRPAIYPLRTRLHSVKDVAVLSSLANLFAMTSAKCRRLLRVSQETYSQPGLKGTENVRTVMHYDLSKESIAKFVKTMYVITRDYATGGKQVTAVGGPTGSVVIS